MGYTKREGDGYYTGGLTDWESSTFRGSGQDGPQNPKLGRCLTITDEVVITFNDTQHGFCRGQVEMWHKSTADILLIGSCGEAPYDLPGHNPDTWIGRCDSKYENSFFRVDDVVFGPVTSPLSTDRITFDTSDICQTLGHWPNGIPRGPGGVGHSKKVSYHNTKIERKCLFNNQDVLTAMRLAQNPAFNAPRNLDFICWDFGGPGLDMVKNIGDCLATLCDPDPPILNQNKIKIDNFFKDLMNCGLRIPRNLGETDQEERWEQCVQAAYDNLCRGL